MCRRGCPPSVRPNPGDPGLPRRVAAKIGLAPLAKIRHVPSRKGRVGEGILRGWSGFGWWKDRARTDVAHTGLTCATTCFVDAKSARGANEEPSFTPRCSCIHTKSSSTCSSNQIRGRRTVRRSEVEEEADDASEGPYSTVSTSDAAGTHPSASTRRAFRAYASAPSTIVRPHRRCRACLPPSLVARLRVLSFPLKPTSDPVDVRFEPGWTSHETEWKRRRRSVRVHNHAPTHHRCASSRRRRGRVAERWRLGCAGGPRNE